MVVAIRQTQGVLVDAVPAWKRDMLQCAMQSPLLKSRASVAGIAALRERPRAVTLGIGLSSMQTLTAGLPFDVLGMLLAAEQLRRAAGADRVVALIADRHALTNGFSGSQVEVLACAVQEQLSRVRDALGLPLEIMRADALHRTRDHQQILHDVQQLAGAEHPYVKLEVADTEALRHRYRSILKLGWALDARHGEPTGALDERYFDGRFRDWIGTDVGFAYVRPGRTLDPCRPVAAPYLVLDASRRVLLSRAELHDHKLERYLADAPRDARSAILGHLRRITFVYNRAIAPLEGPVPQRVRGVLDHIFVQRSLPQVALKRA